MKKTIRTIQVRTLLAFAVAIMMATELFACPVCADTLDDIKISKILRVAVPQDFAPFGRVGADMTPEGYDIDVANLVAGDLGVKARLVPVTSANRIPYLNAGKVDIVISTLGKNAAREKLIDFSAAYAPFYNGVFGLASDKITGPADLSHKSVGVTHGTVEDLELTKVAPGNAIIKRYEDNNSTVLAFVSGQVEAIATGNITAAALMGKKSDREPVLKFLMTDSPCHIGFNKNEIKLKTAVDMIIAEAKSDGRLDAISRKWLNTALPKGL